jgi:hypothetical protein
MSNFDLLDAAKKLKIKNFRGVLCVINYQNNQTILKLVLLTSKNSGKGTHWVGYAIDPRGIIYFDSYGLAPPKEFLHYVSSMRSIPAIWYSTLPTQKITDPPVCGREVLNVLDAVSMARKPPHKVVHEYTTMSHLNRH